MELTSIEGVIEDINNLIRKEGRKKLRYKIFFGCELVIRVITDAKGNRKLSVERVNSLGETEYGATGNYDCSDSDIEFMIDDVATVYMS